jgi:hypothetical protein
MDDIRRRVVIGEMLIWSVTSSGMKSRALRGTSRALTLSGERVYALERTD